MRIELGQDVSSSDGEALGTVRGVVVDAGRREVTRLLVEAALGAAPRLVDVSAAVANDDGGLRLDTTRAEFDQLPEYVTREVSRPDREPEFPVIIPAGGVGGPVLADDTVSGRPGGGSLLDVAPTDPPVVEVESNLLFSESVLGEDAAVVSSDGHKVGRVDAVIVGERGAIEAIVARAGFLFHHDVRLPASAVAEYDTDRVHLSVTRDEAERYRA